MFRVLGIGAGYFAGFHLEAWAAHPGCTLVGLADAEPGKARARAQVLGLGTVEAGEDAEALLGRTAPDIVDIAVPPPGHAALIRAALAARPRAIVCQKPFCRSLEEARQVTTEAEAAGIPLVVHENFRFQPWYRKIRGALDAGLLGELYQIAFRLRPGDGQGPSAYLDRQPYFQSMERFLVHETAIHFIDTFRFLMGEPAWVFADLRRLNPTIAGEDAGHILFGYDDGRRALFDGNRLGDHAAPNRRLTMGEALVEGSEGALGLDGEGSLFLRRFGENRAEAFGGDYPREGFGGGCVAALQGHVARHLTSGTPLENRAPAYLRNLEIEAAVYRSAEQGRRIELQPEER